ncbi:hypothetical protein ACQ27_gp090 [Klebsiella phage K64-1]|nr:hypothetical protein ACQ27_gp090 [Klebsiella phage K64-1]
MFKTFFIIIDIIHGTRCDIFLYNFLKM